MILFNIGVLPYDHNIAYNTLKQVAYKNALKKDNITILFKYRKAKKNIQSERDRISDQISSYSIFKLNIIMILVKFDRIPIMKDQIKCLLLPIVKVKEQIIIMVDSFHSSEDKEKDYSDIQCLMNYFKLKFFIVYLDKDQVRNDIFQAIRNFDQNQILELSNNYHQDLITIQNITKQLNDIHQKIIAKNFSKTNNKRQNKQNKKNNKKYKKIQQEIQHGNNVQEFGNKVYQLDQYMENDFIYIPSNGINQNILPNQTPIQYDIEDYQEQPLIIERNENNQLNVVHQIHLVNDNEKKKKGWSCNLI